MRKFRVYFYVILTAIIFLSATISPSPAPAGKIPASELPFSVRTKRIKKGDSYFKLFGKNWKIVRNLNGIDEKSLRLGEEIIFPAAAGDWEKAKKWAPLLKFNREFSGVKKAILVDLKTQYFGAYEYGKLKFFGPISSGSEKCVKTVTIRNGGEEEYKEIVSNCETPAGKFRSLARHKDHVSSEYQDAEGNGVKMPFAVMFSIQKDPDKNIKTAFWIHGGALPGYPASHGCVRVLVEDAEKIFYFIGQKNQPKEEKDEPSEIEWFSPKKSISIIIIPAK